MRYQNIRKYPITQIKKDNRKELEQYINRSLGVTAALLAVVFVEGLVCGYMIKR